ncbi:chemotaxis protein CheB [Uliginosibacterium sp. sgz301328]|uniref:chemotaxis protein CheB n=1 Tax=Uliginosibacterium sp. sgz301328 TaxID=3243764 RepID=UPI00359E82CB
MSNRPAIDAVVIGASAGGVDAIGQLLSALPQDFGLPIMFVLHLPAGHSSLLPEVLGHYCRLPVCEALDKQPIAGGTVYCAPADCHLLVEPDFTLSLSIDDPVNFSRPSIDLLFESAAYAYRARLLAIVLTGASSDGANGLATVRACGGRAWVQQPAQAAHATMPSAAIARAGADAILSLPAMADALQAISTYSPNDNERQAHHD